MVCGGMGMSQAVSLWWSVRMAWLACLSVWIDGGRWKCEARRGGVLFLVLFLKRSRESVLVPGSSQQKKPGAG